jgi:hypothetical protein
MALTCKKSLSLQVGDYVWCKYSAASGIVGTFTDLATKDDADVGASVIPVGSTATPDGYFKFICVGEDYLGRKKLVADRNIQHSITWDALNTAGLMSGKPIELGTPVAGRFLTLRSLTGGTSGTDKDNEWDKIIVESTLNGTITAGSNSIWNAYSAGNVFSWVSTAVPSNSAYRTLRGGSTSVSGIDITTASNTGNGNVAFRPVLLIETTSITKMLLQDGTTLYSVNGGVRSIVGSTPVTESMFLNNGMDDLSGITAGTISDLTAPKVLLYKST